VPENIELYESVDQMAVLSIADAFLTHCGMNSASEGLYFGVPLILFPQTPEQDAVARRTEELGAGLRLPSIEEEDIVTSIEGVLREPRFKQAAETISDSFRQCGGIQEAVDFITKPGWHDH
jgi:UDP:flavonoid glycosyltransferase YjiC (YdhE family)